MKRFYLMLCFLMSVMGSAWGQETYTISFNGSIVQTPEGSEFFAVKKTDGSAVSYRNVGCTYNDFSYTKGVKLESKTQISFDNNCICDVKIVQYLTDGATIKFDNKSLDVPEGNTEGMYYEYVIENVAPGNHIISRVGGEVTLFLVSVEYKTVENNFSISDFNYTTNISGNSLDRELGGFEFDFVPNNSQFVKVNESYRFFFRKGEAGTLTISPDDNNSDCNINKVVLHAFTPSDLSSLTGFSVTDADGNDLTYTTDETTGTITITCANPTAAVNIITTSDFICAESKGNLYIKSIDVTTDREVTFEKITPNLTFENEEKSVVKGTATVTNVLSTTPSNFAVTYSITEDPNSIISKIAATGEVTLNTDATGTATITASFVNNGNKYYESASKSYTITVTSGYPSEFTVEDLNYAGQSSSKENNLDRTIGGFTLAFDGGEAIKYNADNNFYFRKGEGNQGTLTITPTDSENKITKVVINTLTDITDEKGFSATAATADGVNVEANGKALTVTPTSKAGNVVISTDALSADVKIASIYIETTKQITDAMVTPTLSFNNSTVDVLLGGTVSNALTTSPKNFRGVTYSSSNTDVATVDASGNVSVLATGKTTITATFAGTDYFNAVSAEYILNVLPTSTYEPGSWDFTSWTESDFALLSANDGNWKNDSDNRYVSAIELNNSANILSNIHNGLTVTAPAGKVSVYYSDAEEADGSFRLHDHSAVINLPALTAGQTIIVTTKTTAPGNARGIVFTGDNAEKVVLMEGSATSTEKNTVRYYVTEKISGVSFTSSHNGLYIYSIVLGQASLYWRNGNSIISSIDVTESNHSTTLKDVTSSNTDGVTYSSDNEAVTVAANGKITIKTFTAGTSANITATSGSESVVLKVNMKLEASISYEQTTAEGTVGFSFVEPVLTKNPEGLNVVKWKSSKPEVATVVESTGEVMLVSAGTTIITAYIEENNYYAYQEASYTLTVNAAPADLQTPWTLSVVTPGSDSKASGSTGHKLTMTSTGTIKPGQMTEEIPGLTLSFGKYGDTTDWTVGTPGSGYTSAIVAQGVAATVDEETNYPTGGTYLGLEPTVNGILSLDASYFASQSVVLVDKSTQTVVASYSAQTDEFADKEFSAPLQAAHTYYLYNAGNGNSDDPLQIHAITFTPVFLDRIGHVVVKTNTYNITGEQLYENRHDYPTFSNVHDEEGGSVHYNPLNTGNIYFDADGIFYVEGEGSVQMTATVSHKKENNGTTTDCASQAKCTVTYTKTALKFSKTSFEIGSNLISEFVEPTLNVPAELADLVTYSITGDGFEMDEDGNITAVPESGATATITATIGDNLYYTGSVSYTLRITDKQVPYNVETTVTVPVGTVAYSLIYGESPAITLDEKYKDLQKRDDSDKHTWEKLTSYDPSTTNGYTNIAAKFFATKEDQGLISADKSIVRINNKIQIDALTEGTTTVTIPARELVDANSATYLARTIVITVNVVKDEESDYYNNVYNATEGNSSATYRSWNFHQGFDATELQLYVGNYTPLYNNEQATEAEPFKTHLPNPNEFWEFDKETEILTSKVVYRVTDNKVVDRSSIAFIANEPMNRLTQTTTTYNAFGNSKGAINEYHVANSEVSPTFDNDDQNVLTFFTFRSDDGWTGDNLHTVSNIRFNTSTSLCGITGVNNEQSVTPYKALYLESQQGSAVRVNDIKPGMWMSVIVDNTTAGKDFGRVQDASDGVKIQAFSTSLYNNYADSKDTNLDKFNYNRVTNIFPYQKSGGNTHGIEPNKANNITNIIVGYPVGMGTMNTGGGEKSPKVNNIQRTYGYATFVSPYNIDLTGQTALKAYICDYYGWQNNLLHMVQIKHIPAGTPVMLKGYARDKFVLFMSEGNKPVEHGISEEVFQKNRLVGTYEDMVLNPTEEGMTNDGEVTTWHNMGLSGNKFLTFTKPSTITANKAYVRITQKEYEDLYAAHVAASAASTTTKIVFEDTDFDYSSDVTTPTGIENLENVTVTVGDGHYYNLNGVRVNGIPTQKGIYIRNGKKIVVR